MSRAGRDKCGVGSADWKRYGRTLKCIKRAAAECGLIFERMHAPFPLKAKGADEVNAKDAAYHEKELHRHHSPLRMGGRVSQWYISGDAGVCTRAAKGKSMILTWKCIRKS